MHRLCRIAVAALILPFASIAAESPRTYLAPWIVVAPGDLRLAALDGAAPAPLSVNAPGLLLEVAPANVAGEDARAAASRAAAAHRAGKRFGLSITLAEVPVPTDARGAEAATAETLYPGLGRLLLSGRDADLFVLVFPDLAGDSPARSFVLKRVAAEIRAQSPGARIAAVFREASPGALFPKAAGAFLDESRAAYVDEIGLELLETATPADALRAAADQIAFGRPLFVRAPRLAGPEALLAFAARLAAVDAPAVASPLDSSPERDAALDRLGALLTGDFSRDGRTAAARTPDGRVLAVARLVAGTDLGGIVLVPGVDESGAPARGPVSLQLDAPSYSAAEVVELATGRSKRFDVPKTAGPTVLSVSTASGPVAVRLTAREKSPVEETKARVGVSAERGLTADEVLARHQAWRARRDARWSRFVARNSTSIRFRFADLNNTLDLTLAGLFFFEPAKGYDWAWSEAYFNGVRWRGKKIPELPLVQPEKVSELPLSLTFNDAYRYELRDEDTVDGTRCYVLAFSPKVTASDRPLYDGRVYVSKSDFALIRTVTRQLNLVGEVQSVDETSDFGLVPATDGGEPLRFPTRARSQWILRTFSRTTVIERETVLSEVRLDPADYDALKKASYASKDVMVRDTDKGVRYLEKTKGGDRVVVEDAKTAQLFGLGGVFYDSSLDYPLPLLGVYYIDLDFRKRHQQVQVFFGGVLLAASFNEPKLFGTRFDLGGDVFGIAVKGSDVVYRDGVQDDAQLVKQRSFAGNVNLGTPVGRHVKLSATLGVTHRDFSEETDKTSPDFAIPSNHWVTRLGATAIWDVQGWAFSARYQWSRRSDWQAWGYAGNPDYDPGKDQFSTWSAQLAKDFHLPSFQRIRSSAAYYGSSNTDRFSKYGFGAFGGTSLRGFRSGSLRAEQFAVGRVAYGVVVGEAFRLEGIYEHAFVKDAAAGLDWASFAGAGISGQIPGPWSTIVQLDAGTPVVGRNRGQGGVTLNLVFLKFF